MQRAKSMRLLIQVKGVYSPIPNDRTTTAIRPVTAAGIHRTYASSIERGKVQVSLAIASQVTLVLQLKLSELMVRMESEKMNK